MANSASFFHLIEDDLDTLNKNLKSMVKANHPILYAAAEHLFKAGGKRIRPVIVLLVAKATVNSDEVLDSHKRLAEITEIIHTASLVHDDVLDDCSTRRGMTTVHNTFNVKIAILAGDFLFAQSSWYLANLGHLNVVKIISKVITDFAEGEVRQGSTHFDTSVSMHNYIEKSFYKTASLIAASCQGAAILTGSEKKVCNNLYLYGKHLGLAFQIIDDLLDITSSSQVLGKPQGADLKNGNLTAPLLFTITEKPEITKLINREFRYKEDINTCLQYIKEGKGIQKSKDLASEHIQTALISLEPLSKNNEYVIGLRELAIYTLERLN
nr:preA [Erythrotrichia foliiformis]